ncbi:MAG: tRNA (adenosine(37)-N6)-threonylcarbamoyltransferase complex ATPase subunit type 1 TsaE [Campylobacterota bacterium]|nr:tRNA (adenosine(37)-N6)-threonylcarbamoyltransferase complex ATPase subunit type 1 TsaE [Campylobacterota bacterium]
MVKKFELDADNIDTVVNELKLVIDSKDIIVLLQGDLASGKTTLVKHFIKSLNISDNVTSPTFSIQTVYDEKIYHYDMYNKTLNEFISLGLLEEFENKGIHFVEWGDDKLKSILEEYGFDVLTVKINKLENKREYIIES